MRKTSLLLLLLCLYSINCSEHQREGWVKRFENFSGSGTKTEQKDTLNPDHFNLTKDKQELIGLETTVVKKMTIDDILELPAEIVSNPNNIVSVNAPVNGKILSITVTIGSSVEKNGMIAVIENPQNLGQRFEIRSPMNGVVTMRQVTTGEWVESGKQLIEIVDYSSLHGLIRLYPDEQSKVRLGQTVEFETNGVKVRGKIMLISPTFDSNTRTIEVRVEISNSDNKLKANAYAQAQIIVNKKVGLIVPHSAVLNEETQHVVFLQRDNNYEKRIVEIGIQRNDTVEIINGLEEGDIVVSKGAYQLKNISFTSKAGEEEHE